MTITKKTAVVIAAATIAGASITASTVSILKPQSNASSASSDASERTIAGVWRTLITPRNCQTGDPLTSPFQGLITFHEGGTVSEFGVGPGSSPDRRSPGHGVWQREHGWPSYSFRFTHYNYDVNGVLVGSVDITAALELGASGDEYTTSATAEIFDANHNLIGRGCTTTSARRFE
jgi:hypothetical protein